MSDADAKTAVGLSTHMLKSDMAAKNKIPNRIMLRHC